MEEYFKKLRGDFERAYSLAQAARAKGFDPEAEVEIIPAADMAARVEGIVGPQGVADGIRALGKDMPREMVAFEIARQIIDGGYIKGDKEKLIDQAVRTGVAILTEGVLVAPTEGIAKIKIRTNPDGSDFVGVYFAGPIRSAGGTVAALSVVLADFARNRLGIGSFRPTETMVERYVEEINLYHARAARLQYKPTDDEVRHIVRNCPVCVDGEPTEEFEVSVYKNVPGVETNRVRGGIGLVTCEGIAQKASKVFKYTKKLGLEWSWLEKLIKVAKKEGVTEVKPDSRYLDDLVAGRPIFSYPCAPGGFRLRYGRTRTTGIAAKAIHPATMIILESFPAIGTQLKLERPGKGCVISPCDSILGPVVKLRDGSVVELASVEEAVKVLPEVRKILFLGDILVSYGDFLKSNSTLLPCGYCEERWELELAKASGGKHAKVNHSELTAEEAFKISESSAVPLHPKYTYPWNDITPEQMQALARWLAKAKLKYDWFKLREVSIEGAPEKSILEELCIPHAVKESNVILSSEHAHALLRSLGLLKGKAISLERFEKEFNAEIKPVELASKLAGVRIMQKAPVYIGSRMGRPEKARERKMKPAPHVLFPIGSAGGKLRSITKAYKFAKERRYEGKGVMEEVARLRCPSCGNIGIQNKCPSCGARTILQRTCSKCGRPTEAETCHCGGAAHAYDTRPVDLPELMDKASERVGHMPVELKGVKGMTSANKIPEPLEKGLLREKHGVFVFKDGTARFDATDMVITHFCPREVGVSVEKLRELGYAKDYEGKELASPDQLLELKPQDLLLSDNGADYISKVAKFVDDELVYLYGLSPFYNIKSREDLLGQLVVGLSPHTSAGVLARVVGFTRAHVGYAHPYFHAAKRRNCDGDEDTVMLLMDALLNFSRAFLPASRGGQMDAALVLSTIIDPKEVDDEVHAMEVCSGYPLELYEAADNFGSPSEVKIEKVGERLGTPGQYFGLMFTHRTSSIDNGPVRTRYIELKTMKEKIAAQFALCAKIRAVDVKDAAERVVLQHFIPDLYGNLRSFSRQVFRCVNCNWKYRRVPLRGNCTRCGGKLLLTINKGGIEKYLKISKEMVAQYELPDYLKQRLALVEVEIASVFEDETSKQFNLSEFM